MKRFELPRDVLFSGAPLAQASHALVMVHGRGATAQSILALAEHLPVAQVACVAPQAPGHTWYPHSFLAPRANNEPALSQSLARLGQVIADLQQQGFPPEKIFLLGFSQGACLVSEFACSHAQPYAGVFVFTGGLPGAQLERERYHGSLAGMPMLLSSSDPDPHVPLTRVLETFQVAEELGAIAQNLIFKDAPHTVMPQALEAAAYLMTQRITNNPEWPPQLNRPPL